MRQLTQCHQLPEKMIQKTPQTLRAPNTTYQNSRFPWDVLWNHQGWSKGDDPPGSRVDHQSCRSLGVMKSLKHQITTTWASPKKQHQKQRSNAWNPSTKCDVVTPNQCFVVKLPKFLTNKNPMDFSWIPPDSPRLHGQVVFGMHYRFGLPEIRWL